MSPMSIRWLGPSDRDAAARVWKPLERRLESEALTCSWDWTEVWLRHYGDVVPHRFAIGQSPDGRPYGVALVTSDHRRRGPFLVRRIHLGTAGEPPGEGVYVEYNRVLVEPGQRRRFAEALLRELGADRGWDELTLDGFAPEDALPFLLSEPRLTDRLEPCRTVDLRRAGPAGGHVLPILPSSARRKVRRSLDVLGDVETEWAETEDHALDILEELVLLHQTRWTAAGRPGAFASRRVASFHRELVARLLPRGAVILFRIRARSGTVGCLYHFVERDRVLFYQSGFSPFENDRAVTSGFVTHALCMQSCFDRGLVEYDFLAGQSRYKDDLATDTRELVWATYRRPAVKWRIVDALAAAKRA